MKINGQQSATAARVNRVDAYASAVWRVWRSTIRPASKKPFRIALILLFVVIIVIFFISVAVKSKANLFTTIAKRAAEKLHECAYLCGVWCVRMICGSGGNGHADVLCLAARLARSVADMPAVYYVWKWRVCLRRFVDCEFWIWISISAKRNGRNSQVMT